VLNCITSNYLTEDLLQSRSLHLDVQWLSFHLPSSLIYLSQSSKVFLLLVLLVHQARSRSLQLTCYINYVLSIYLLTYLLAYIFYCLGHFLYILYVLFYCTVTNFTFTWVPISISDHNLIVCVFRLAKVKVKVIQLEGLVCVIYMTSSICGGDTVLVKIFSRFSRFWWTIFSINNSSGRSAILLFALKNC